MLTLSPTMFALAAVLACGVLGMVVVEPAGAAPEDRERWDRKYASEEYIFGTEPITFLRDNIDLLPRGKALDIAMGEGRNGIYLATHGFEVTGLDISEKGLRKARALATARGVHIETKAVDLEHYELPVEEYDVILCIYYLQRGLFPQIMRALKPGGMALVETHTVEFQKYRPSIPRRYLLESNELLRLFDGMRVLRYQDRNDGEHEASASILVRKPGGSDFSAH